MPAPNSPELNSVISKFYSDNLPVSLFGETGTFELPRGTIAEFSSHGSTRENDGDGLAYVEEPIQTVYGGYVRSYDEAPLPPNTALLRLRPVTALGLAELRKPHQDRDYGTLSRESVLATQEALARVSVFQLLEGGTPEPSSTTSVEFTVRVSESTIDILDAVMRYMAERPNQL